MSTILLWCLLLRTVANNLWTFAIISRLWPRLPEPRSSLVPDLYLVIVLKVFEETETIADSVHRIRSEIEGCRNVSVIIVGTIRERDVNGINGTLKIAFEACREDKRFLICESPYMDGSHARQNNYAISQIKTTPHNTWILTMDIDSHFGATGLSEMTCGINAGTLIMQQSTLFLSNFKAPPLSQQAHAIYQSRWTITHEIKRILLHNLTHLSIAHVVGHGLCVNMAKLQEYGGFPEESSIEDVHLGFYFVLGKEYIQSLRSLEIAESPPDLNSGLKQEYVWSFGALSYPLYLKTYLKRFSLRSWSDSFRATLLILEGVTSYIAWSFMSWIILYLSWHAIAGSILSATILGLYYLEFFQCIVFFWIMRLVPPSTFFFSPLLFLLSTLRRSLPANLAAVHLILRRPFVKFKTPHHSTKK
jgi:hypothetical protein